MQLSSLQREMKISSECQLYYESFIKSIPLLCLESRTSSKEDSGLRHSSFVESFLFQIHHCM